MRIGSGSKMADEDFFEKFWMMARNVKNLWYNVVSLKGRRIAMRQVGDLVSCRRPSLRGKDKEVDS